MNQQQSPIRLLIADDHKLMRSGLRALFQSHPEFTVVGEAVDGVQTLELTRQLKPDVLLLDLSMPRGSGINVLEELSHAESPRVVLFTAAIDKAEEDEAFRLGARGLVLKDSAVDVLVQSIKTVMDGNYWLENKPASTGTRSEKPLARVKRSGT